MPEKADFDFDVFLSHSPRDETIVLSLAKRLKGDGLRVWLDSWEIKPGDSIPAKTEEGLERSRVLVLCMSENAFGTDWVQLESYTFRFRDPLNRARRFVPLRLDTSPINASLAHFMYVDWRVNERKRGYDKLLKACRWSPEAMAVLNDAATSDRANRKIARLEARSEVLAWLFSATGAQALSGGKDHAVRLWDVESGRCLREFKEHTGNVHCLAWSVDQTCALSGAVDETARMWELATGRCLKELKGHRGMICDVAWAPNPSFVLTAGEDQTIRLWNVNTGHCQHEFQGHEGWVWSVAWGADHRHFLTGSYDNTVRLWDVEARRCVRVFEGHSDGVYDVQFSQDQRRALSCAGDKTVRLWDIETGRCLRVLEGHTDRVFRVDWNGNQRHALSASWDNTVRLWDVDSGQSLGILEGHSKPLRGVGWSDDGRYAFSGDMGGVVQRWGLSEAPIVRRVAIAQHEIQYTNAKVLLVGDTGVGKSGLAERLVRKQFVATKSSHARRAHLLDSRIIKETDNVTLHQEAVLWDLAGQPGYRLVHQLSMDDAALACVLFDCRNETNPFESAAFWSQVLDQARTNTKPKKLLVASRIDMGGLPASEERIEAFRLAHGFAKFIATSASTGEGCDALLEAILDGIAWDHLPKITTTKTLAALREYIVWLKGEQSNQDLALVDRVPSLLTIDCLHQGFIAHLGNKIALDEFIAHLQRLEATDAIDILIFHTTGGKPHSEDFVLLDPTRVDAYASALLVAARDEPDGPGHLLEARVRDGEFRLDKEQRLPEFKSEQHVLWFVVENLLSRDLALREKIRGKDYLVFPSQCTAELRLPGVAAFGVAFGLAGPVRSIYATLIAQLAHYEGFKKREFFQDAAAYRAEAGGRCIVRLRDRGRGEGELDVLFDKETPLLVRQGFLEFVSKHLEARSTPGSVTRRYAYHCANAKCGEVFEDRVVKANLDARRKDLLCPFCRRLTRLVDLLTAPTTGAEEVAAQIGIDARVGRQRMTAALVIKAKESESRFDVFLSQNSKDKGAVEKIARRLLAVGIRPWLDKWHLPPGSTLADALEQAIKTIPCAALCFGPSDIGNWHILEIRAFVERWASGNARIVPIILPGVHEAPQLPVFVRQTLWADMREWENEDSDSFYLLVCGLLGRAPGDSPLKKFGARQVIEWQKARR